MISLKPGVKLVDLKPQTVLAVTIAEHIWWNAAQTTLVVTSCNDGQHKEGSFHYLGAAADLRIKTMPERLRPIAVQQLRAALGTDFDVLHEGIGTEQEHIHLEWDPK